MARILGSASTNVPPLLKCFINPITASVLFAVLPAVTFLFNVAKAAQVDAANVGSVILFKSGIKSFASVDPASLIISLNLSCPANVCLSLSNCPCNSVPSTVPLRAPSLVICSSSKSIAPEISPCDIISTRTALYIAAVCFLIKTSLALRSMPRPRPMSLSSTAVLITDSLETRNALRLAKGKPLGIIGNV